MKKAIFISICFLMAIVSCVDKPRGEATMHTTNNNTYLDINDCRYYQIKIGNHTAYQYKVRTNYGYGSDIIHFEDMCEYCSNKQNSNQVKEDVFE